MFSLDYAVFSYGPCASITSYVLGLQTCTTTPIFMGAEDQTRQP